MISKLYDAFKNPGAEYRGKPFWSWNGKLEKEELLRQVHIIKDMGFGGFFMHSRTGLQTEYLGEEWFGFINTCADEAEKLGLEAWLYDEDRWPSGTAGGIVTKNPKYRAKFIYLEIVSPNEFNWGVEVIAAFSCRLEGINYYECEQIFPDYNKEVYDGKSILVFSIKEMEKSSFYNGYTYVDTLNREATDEYIRITHEKYKEKSGDKFGKIIKGIFTDEPHRGPIMSGFGISNKNPGWYVPWTYTLVDNFKNKFGYDLVAKLPEIFLIKEGKKVSQVKWHYVELLQEMFLDNFAKPINEWCHKNNLIFTGHILHEDSLTAQTALSGSMMRFYEHMEYPGVDVLTEGNCSYWTVKQASSAARQLGQKWILSELYGGTGWQMSFEGHKSVGDWQALFGINLRCHHLSWYTMEGESKRDYPASILHQSAWWKEYGFVEEYFSRIGVVMTNGRAVCDVLVINSVESVWCQVYVDWTKRLDPLSIEIQELERNYQDLFHWLIGARIDFDYGDEEMMSRLYKIGYDDENNPILEIGQAKYRVVIVPEMTTIRSTTIKILKEFMLAGGNVIFAGKVPDYVDALVSDEAISLSENNKAKNLPFEKDSIVSACDGYIKTKVSVIDSKTGESINDIYCQVREDEDNEYILLMNINREKSYKDVKIKINSNGSVQEWDLVSGERYIVKNTQRDEGIETLADFYASREHLYVITKEKDNGLLMQPTYRLKTKDKIEGSFEYDLNEPNVCVLDLTSFKIEDGAWQEETEILKVDRAVRKHYGLDYRAGDMIQPWLKKDLGYSDKGKITLCFDFEVDEIPENPIELVMERPDNFNVKLNDKEIDVSKINGWWIDICFKRISISSDALKRGSNVLTIESIFNEGINLEAVYLIGNFGVKLNESIKIISSLPKELKIGDTTNQGLPFYSGSIIYKLNLEHILKNNERAFINFKEINGACIKVHIGDKTPQIIAWQPYEADITEALINGLDIEVEVVLTRRNTFGPLHQLPLLTPAYAPSNFITEGDKFSMPYTLISSGLTAEPYIVVKN